MKRNLVALGIVLGLLWGLLFLMAETSHPQEKGTILEHYQKGATERETGGMSGVFTTHFEEYMSHFRNVYNTKSFADAVDNHRRWRTKRLYERRNEYKQKKDKDRILEEIIRINSTVNPYVPNTAFLQYDQKFYDPNQKELFTTKRHIRKWERSNGQTFDAALAAVNGTVAIFMDETGEQIKVSIPRLIESDRKRTKKHLEGKK